MRKDTPQLDRFAEECCLDHIEKAVAGFVECNHDKLEHRSRIRAEGARLEDVRVEFTANVKTYGNAIGFDAVVSADIEIYEAVRGEDRSDLVTQWFRVPCQVIFEEKVERFRINDGKGGGIEVYSKSVGTRSPLAATNDLVPVIYGEDYDEEATRFLKKFCPEALETAMPVPLEKIAAELGLPPIKYEKHLSPDFSVFGGICFADEKIDVFDSSGAPEKIHAHRGQIFIDNDTYILCNVGCIRNTIAHELFHWVRHRLYSTINRLFGSSNFRSLRCRINPQGASKKTEDALTDEEWMELQANAISPRIIMPKETALPKAMEILAKHGYNPEQPDESKLRAAIAELAEFFQVSRQLATVRLSQFGFPQAQDIFDADYDRNISCASQVPIPDVFKEYKTDDSFRQVIDSDMFRYAEGRFVINDAKYINKVDGGIYILTDYAREHLDECALRFETIETTESGFRGDGLYRKNKSDTGLLKKYVHDAATLQTAEAVSKASQAFASAAARHRDYLKAIGSGAYFSESFNALMKTYFEPIGVQSHKFGAEFFERTGLSDKVFRDMRNGNEKYCPSHKTIVTLCAGFDFGLEIAEALLAKGGKAFSNTDEHIALKALLTVFRGNDIYILNDYFAVMGFGRLTDD